RVRISVLQKAASAGAGPEGTVSTDSDVNPAAAYPAPSSIAQTPPAGQEQPTDVQQQAQAQQPAAQAQQPAAQAQPAQTGSAAAEDAEILAEAAARSPQKQLFLPPREDQKFAYKPPEQPAQTQSAQAAPSTPETPNVTGENASPSQAQAEVPLAEAPPQGAPQAESNGASAPASAGGELALNAPETPPEQAAPAPPEQAAQPAQPGPEQPVQQTPPEKQGPAQLVSSLPRLSGSRNAATFYVQLGAYSTQEVAQGMAASLVQTYPVVVLAPAAGTRQIYKLLVGPLNKAESGTLLPLFRFRGFRDAFVRRE
ncbi:MAG TPA: SPOR domain-containing protein, partial [Spirochaetia bacterium]|nr:SPOR domain-containing protein [Spirochaetia bacterium]